MWIRILAVMIIFLGVGCGNESIITPTTQATAPITIPSIVPTNSQPATPNTNTNTPIMITARIDRAPRVGETAVVTWMITSVWDAPEVRAMLELPASVEVVAGAPTWNGALAANQSQTNTTTIKIVQPGVIDIRAVVQSGPQGGDTWSDVDHVYLTVTATDAAIGLP